MAELEPQPSDEVEWQLYAHPKLVDRLGIVAEKAGQDEAAFIFRSVDLMLEVDARTSILGHHLWAESPSDIMPYGDIFREVMTSDIIAMAGWFTEDEERGFVPVAFSLSGDERLQFELGAMQQALSSPADLLIQGTFFGLTFAGIEQRRWRVSAIDLRGRPPIQDTLTLLEAA